jgi:Flp pilus assembly protein TadG
MSMCRSFRNWSQRGQTLVIVAAAMVGLLALAGLAIDGGNLVMERRRAQNAADAGALAGTRLLSLAMMTCDPIDLPELDDEIARAVNEYAETNGISDTDGVPGNEVNDNVVAYYVDPSETRLGTVGAMGTVPMGSSGVEVELRDQHRTYFLPVVGIRNIPSSAEAMAMTGIVTQLPPGAGMLPIAVPQIVVDDIDPNTDWEMFDTSPDKDKEGQFCYDSAGTEICIDNPDSPVNALRGWLNLNHIYNTEYLTATSPDNRTFDKNVSNDGCKEPLPGLAGYASGDCPYAYPIYAGTSCYGETIDAGEVCTETMTDGDFIHGSPGSRSSSLMQVYDGYAGKEAYAPVFDQVYLREYMVDNFDPAEPPVGFESSGGGFSTSAGGSGDSWYYHVVGYVATAIPAGADSNKVLRGEFLRAPISAGKIDVTAWDGTCSLLMHGVTLWR